jgi:hypothetical protein
MHYSVKSAWLLLQSLFTPYDLITIHSVLYIYNWSCLCTKYQVVCLLSFHNFWWQMKDKIGWHRERQNHKTRPFDKNSFIIIAWMLSDNTRSVLKWYEYQKIFLATLKESCRGERGGADAHASACRCRESTSPPRDNDGEATKGEGSEGMRRCDNGKWRRRGDKAAVNNNHCCVMTTRRDPSDVASVEGVVVLRQDPNDSLPIHLCELRGKVAALHARCRRAD